MSETLEDDSVLSSPVALWLLPLGNDESCGPDLEYDPESLELVQAAAGKAETQFAPGEPPDWARVRDLAEALFERTRDLRVALWWSRAKLNLDGLAALPAALTLLHGLLDQFWEDLHPLPDVDDPDSLARLSVLGGLDKLDSLLGDVRNARLSSDRRLQGLRVRDVEVALAKLAPRADETPRSQAEIMGVLSGAAEAADDLRRQTNSAARALNLIETLMSQRFSPDLMVDLTRIRAMLTGVQAVLPVATEDSGRDVDPAPVDAGEPKLHAQAARGVHSVETRQDAIRAIELVCAYLERSEPTNPAQFLLRRAARVIDKNFLQLVNELAPDSVKDVARIMGVDPSTLRDQN